MLNLKSVIGNSIIKKIGRFGLVILCAFFCISSHINAWVDEERTPSLERDISLLEQEQQPPQYVPGEVLVKFKEGVEPQVTLLEIGLGYTNMERVHSIKPVVDKFRKEYKLEKDEDGWYWYRGKNYKEVIEISEEELFEQACQQMSPERQGLYRSYKITLPEEMSVEEAVVQLRNNPDIEYAYPNYIRKFFSEDNTLLGRISRKISIAPNDPDFNDQWALTKIKAPEAWDITEGSPEIIIAVIDSGVDYNHEDLADNIWINKDEIPNNAIDDDGNGYIDDARGWDFVNAKASPIFPWLDPAPGEDPGPPDNDPMDFYGHGTHCAGIAIAVKGNSKGIAGVAPKSKIMALRAGYKTSSGEGAVMESYVKQAIKYAIDNGVKVISMSFGGPGQGAYDDELKIAYAENIVLVAAAGNSGGTSLETKPMYPAAMDKVMAVVATDKNDNKAAFSSYGSWVDVSAPGEGILSTWPKNKYVYASGTSMACPHVSGLASLILARTPALSNNEVRERIKKSCDDISPSEKDNYTGYGRINAYYASLVFGVSITSPLDQGYIRGSTSIKGSAFIEKGFQEYQLYYASADKPNNTTLITSRSASVSDGVLGTWDTTKLSEGEYILILKLFTTDGKKLTHTIKVTIDNINQPPVFTNLIDKAAVINRILEFKVEAKDPDDPQTPYGQLAYSADNLPPSAQFDAQTQLFTWMPYDSDKGAYKVTFSVQDNKHITTKEITISTIAIEETPITTASGSQTNPAIYQNRIVWEDMRNGNADIYMARVFYAPLIISVDSLVSPGDILTVIGKNFGSTQEDSQVQFESGAVCLIESWSDTQITCKVPNDAKTGLLRVINQGGISNGVMVKVDQRPSVVSLSPNSGIFQTDIAYTFSTVFSDLDGYNDLNQMFLLINTGLSNDKYAFYAHYNKTENKLYLYNSSSGWTGGYAPGSNNVIETTYGKLNCSQTTVSGSGNNFTINWKLSFKSAFAGTKNVYLDAEDRYVRHSGWQQKGTITIK